MQTERTASIRADELGFRVEAKALLERVRLHADQGQLVGLIGPNGAGKSTLLRAIAGVLRPQEGAVWLEGEELDSMPAKDVAARMALVPQIAPYTHGFTARELVLMGRYPHLGRFEIEGAADEAIAREAMELTETEEFAERTLDTLSGGERQRVFVSRALAQQPRVLLLDEPTANLDVLHKLRVLDLVRRLVDEGLTAVAAIHDLGMAARYCDRLVLLSEGRVLADGTPAEVLAPDIIEAAFGVRSAVYPDPVTGSLVVSLIAPADENGSAGTGHRRQRPRFPPPPTSGNQPSGPRSSYDMSARDPQTRPADVPKRPRRRHGLVIVNTGEGKGKTTAALGVIFRAWGRDFKIRMFQFIKHTTATFGEHRAAMRLDIPIEALGDGLPGCPRTWTGRRRWRWSSGVTAKRRF